MVYQVSPGLSWEPITGDLMKVIHFSLLPNDYSHTMFWAARCLGVFGFLQAGEFTVNSRFNTSLQDLQLDSTSNPACLRKHIKCSKTNPFRQGCLVYLGLWSLIYLSHHFLDGIPPSTWSNTSLCSPRWSTLVSGAAVSFPSVNFIGSWDTWFLLQSQLPNLGSNHDSSAGSSKLPNNDYAWCWSSSTYQLYARTPMQSILGRQVTIIGMYSYGYTWQVPWDLTEAVAGSGFPQSWAP